MKRIPLLIFGLCFSFYCAGYDGHWIWNSQNQPDTWLAFRKKANLTTLPANVPATIAVDSKYWLWVNGKQVVREGGLKRTPNPNDTYADTINLRPYLKEGENTIALLVWYWGKEGHGHNGSGHGGLFFEADAGKQKIISDESWKVLLHPAFDTLRYGTQPYRPLAEFNVAYDARKDIGEWVGEKYDDSAWDNVEIFGKPPCKTWGNLVIRPIPQWKDYGLKDYENKFPATSMGNILNMQLPYNAQVTPYFKIKAKAGKRVDIQTDYYTDGGAYNVRAEYVTKDGVQEFECPGWMSGEQVLYCFSPEIEIIELKYRESGYNTSFDGNFVCDDEFYNVLWEKARRTLYVNMRDNFMDCPTRERAMWWGDVVIESQQSYYAFSPDVFRLTQKAIRELMQWQTAEGVLYSPIPGPHPPLIFGPYRELPLQSLAAISKKSLGYYLLFTADTLTLIEAYPAIKKYLSLWQTGDDGLVVHRDGKWNWQDWGRNIDVPLLDNAWYYSALEQAKQIAVLAGVLQDTSLYEHRMQSIRKNFNLRFWTGSEYRSPGYEGETDDRGNAMAVVTGIADKDKWQHIRQVLNRQQHASPYMEKFVLEAMFIIGAEQDALKRMKLRYKQMVESKFSSLPESWYFDSFSQSRNHGWSGGALSLLMQYVAGVEPLKPGYEIFTVTPRTGALKSVAATIPTPHGDIRVHIKDSDTYTINIHVPDGTQAIVRLPDDMHNKKIYLNSKAINDISSPIAPGDWNIEVIKKGQTQERTAFTSELIRREADKLVIGNELIRREICIKEKQYFTQSIKTAQSDRNFVGNNSVEFSFLLNGKLLDGQCEWDLVSVLEKKDIDRGDGVEVKLTNHDLQLDVVLLYVFYRDIPVIKKSIGFVNRSSREMLLEAVDVEKLVTSLNHAVLFSSFGRQKHLSTYYGDHDDAICIVHNYGGNSGILFANETPGVLKKLTFNSTLNDISLGLSGKEARYPFAKYIAPGQEWTAPSVVMLPYSNKIDPWVVMNDEFADYQRKYAGFSLFENRGRRLSFMYNNWIPFNDKFDEKTILELAEAAAQCGIRQFAIDCGWYTTQHAPDTDVSWINNCGDWMVDKKKFPNGLRPVFDRIRALGLEPGLWVSIASASEWAEVFRSHPEWRLLDSKGEPTSIHDMNRDLRTMCFTTGWKQYMKEKLTEMVREYGIRYFKLDLAAVTSAYINEAERSGCYATDHPGHKDHAESYIAIYTELFQLFDELHRQFPDLYIDCTFETEGKMQATDYAFRKHADGNWLTNFQEAYPVGSFRIRNLAWWRSPAMPASSMLIGNRRLDTPEAINELRTMMGTFPIMLGDLRTLSPEKRKEIKRWSDWIVELQNKYDYDLYRRDLPGFGEPAEGSWDGYARINTDTKRGGVIGIFRQGAPDNKRIVLIDGLIPNKTYAVKPDPSASLPVRYLTGKTLAETGFEVQLEKMYEGQLFEIELVE